jgi:hypothetical protein
VADGREGESVELSWDFPMEVKSFVIYGIRPDRARRTDVAVDACSITLLRGGVPLATHTTGSIAPAGTRIDVPVTLIDAARIEILRSRGRVRGEARTGLAEIETLARFSLLEPRP